MGKKGDLQWESARSEAQILILFKDLQVIPEQE